MKNIFNEINHEFDDPTEEEIDRARKRKEELYKPAPISEFKPLFSDETINLLFETFKQYDSNENYCFDKIPKEVKINIPIGEIERIVRLIRMITNDRIDREKIIILRSLMVDRLKNFVKANGYKKTAELAKSHLSKINLLMHWSEKMYFDTIIDLYNNVFPDNRILDEI